MRPYIAHYRTQLRREAIQSVSYLDDGMADGFDVLFMTPVDFYAKCHHYLQYVWRIARLKRTTPCLTPRLPLRCSYLLKLWIFSKGVLKNSRTLFLGTTIQF